MMIKPVKYSADRNESGKLFGSNTLNNLTTRRQLKATASNTEVAKHRKVAKILLLMTKKKKKKKARVIKL